MTEASDPDELRSWREDMASQRAETARVLETLDKEMDRLVAAVKALVLRSLRKP